jgi:hypothetical protein
VIKRWQKLTGKQAVLENDGRTFEDISVARKDPESGDLTCHVQN